jgi:N-formylglutamate amidohydrolase
VSRATAQHFESAGLSVAPNDPYQGGDTTRRLGRPDERLHAIQVELNRDLYMDEQLFVEKEPGFARTADLCAGLVDRLAAIAETL